MRIGFLGVRVPGHLYPMTTLARKLKARGHDVVFISVLDTEPFVTADLLEQAFNLSPPRELVSASVVRQISERSSRAV